MKDTKFNFSGIIAVKLIIALLVIIGIAIYKICTTQKPTQVEESEDMFVKLESHYSYNIMYDKDTKVMYYRGTGADSDLCPLYNADGSLKLYSGGNNND